MTLPVIPFGATQVVKAPGGAMIAFGLIPFHAVGLGGSSTYAAILRPNPFVPAPDGAPPGRDGRGPGWLGIFMNPNAKAGPGLQRHPNENPYGLPLSVLANSLFPGGQGPRGGSPTGGAGGWSGDPLYLFAGTQVPTGPGSVQLVSANGPGNLTPNAGWAGGAYLFRASEAGQNPGTGVIPPIGQAPGTAPNDQADYAWALTRLGPWSAANEGKIKQIDPLTFVSSSTLGAQIAGGTGAGTTSPWLIAALVAAAAFGIYEYA